MDIKVSKDKADGLIQETSLLSDEIVSKTMHRDEEGDQ